MLLELTVEDVAIIERASLQLEPGLTALTGETGAGKSLLVDAIGLALGDRADSELVRSGAPRGKVGLLADVSREPAIVAKCNELGVEPEDGQLSIYRDVSVEGRSTTRLNGRLVSVSELRQLGNLLVDLHGQHDHQALLVTERQVEFLDAWIGEEALGLLSTVRGLFTGTEGLRRRLAGLRASRREREQRLDTLRHQVGEIESAAVRPGEFLEAQATLARLQHAERLTLGTALARQALTAEGAALDGVGVACRELESLVTLDPALQALATQLVEAKIALDEAARSLGAYVDDLEMEPQALEAVAQRLDLLRTLFRKYGEGEEAVLKHLDQAKEELEELQGDTGNEESLAAALGQSEHELSLASSRLTKVRESKAREFGQLVQRHARDLALEHAVFEVDFQRKPVEADGADQVTFLFSANKGEPPRPLAKVASGGEISRLMLAIKVAAAGRAGVPTLIFDEVDTGLSGQAAAKTAAKLAELARHNQVIVISHLPQIAARADHHYRIEKSAERGRTVTRLHRLDPHERVREVARMLAGEEVSQSAIANAEDLLARAGRG